MFTRARDTIQPDNFICKLSDVINQHVYFDVKFHYLCPSDGTYPSQLDKDQQKAVKLLKNSCYREVGREFKAMGIFSSKAKKEFIFPLLREAIRACVQDNLEMTEILDLSRIPRGKVTVSVLRAILNGLRKMKLSDARMPGFDDSVEL